MLPVFGRLRFLAGYSEDYSGAVITRSLHCALNSARDDVTSVLDIVVVPLPNATSHPMAR